MTAIIPEEAHKQLELYNPIAAGLAELEEKYRTRPTDLSVPENYEFCRKAIAEMRKIRTNTEKLRKELKADALEYGRRVDSAAKGIIDKVKEIEEPYAAAKSDYDTKIEIERREKVLAEERRIDGIYARINEIKNLPSLHISSTAQTIELLAPMLNEALEAVNDWAMEFSDKARESIVETMLKLDELHTLKFQQEQLAADKAKMEKEAAERAERDRIQREKEADAERERLAREREKLEEERVALQAERDRISAEQAEKDRVAKEEQEERDRIAKEEQDEKDRLAAEEKQRMQDEIEALRLSQAVPTVPEQEQSQVQPVVEANQNQVQPSTEKQVLVPAATIRGAVDSSLAAQHRNETGRAIMAITGNKITAKAILDAIIAGNIPHTQYTGAIQ